MGGHTLRLRGGGLCDHGALKPVALLQPLPVRGHGRRETRLQIEVAGQHQRITHRHVGRGEAVGTHKVMLGRTAPIPRSRAINHLA